MVNEINEKISPPSIGIPIEAPDLNNLLNRWSRQTASMINCVMIGTIYTFDKETQRADVQINQVQKYLDPIEPDEYETYPLLLNCPVFFLAGQSGRFTIPVKPGDFCLVLFADRDMDLWLQDGKIAPPNSNRMHDFSDAIVLMGIRPLSSPILEFNTLGPEMNNGVSKISVEDKISMSVGGATFLTALNALCDTLISATDTHADAFSPETISALQDAKALIGAILK